MCTIKQSCRYPLFVLLLKVAFSLLSIYAATAFAEVQHQLTMSATNIFLTDAILLTAKLAHKNVLVSPHVMGTTSLHFHQVDAKQAFNLLLRTHHLAKLQQGTIYYIAPVDELIKQQQTEVEYAQLQQKSAHIAAWVRQIRYASAQNIAALLQNDHAIGFLSERGLVKVDLRTNTLAIQDVEDKLPLIKKLINLLDVPVQQVLISARIASVDSDCEGELGLRFDVYPGEEAARHSARQGHYSVAVARLADGSLIDVKLAALEKKGRAELISSPSLSTMNQEPASIEAGEEVPYQEVSESGGTAVTFKKAVLGLKVTPEVLPHDKVLLRLEINQDRPSHKLVQGVPTINTRKLVTQVLVKTGQTIVLGGIYESNQEKGQTHIPFLHRLPILGWLFTAENNTVNKRELLIFVSPKVVTTAPRTNNRTN